MLILGFDSTAVACSAALVDDNKVISEIHLNRGSKHSEQLLPVIDQVLRLADKRLEDLDAIAVTVGPGSFTGVRIAVATGKALAQGLDKKLIAVSSLDALARNIIAEDALIVPLLDARKNEFYSSCYRYRDGILEKVKQEQAVSPQKLFEDLLSEEKVYFVGEALGKYEGMIREILGDNAVLAPASRGSIRGAEVAFIGMEKFLREEFTDYYNMAPLYLRKPEAETTWEAKHSGR